MNHRAERWTPASTDGSSAVPHWVRPVAQRVRDGPHLLPLKGYQALSTYVDTPHPSFQRRAASDSAVRCARGWTVTDTSTSWPSRPGMAISRQIDAPDTHEFAVRDAGASLGLAGRQLLLVENLDDLRRHHRLRLTHIRVRIGDVTEYIAAAAHDLHRIFDHFNISFIRRSRASITSNSCFGVPIPAFDFLRNVWAVATRRTALPSALVRGFGVGEPGTAVPMLQQLVEAEAGGAQGRGSLAGEGGRKGKDDRLFARVFAAAAQCDFGTARNHPAWPGWRSARRR